MIRKYVLKSFGHLDLTVHSITWYMVKYCVLSKFGKPHF